MVVAGAAVDAAPVAGHPQARAASRARQAPPAQNWPQLLLNAPHTSLSTDTTLQASLGNTIGIHWMAPMRAADLGSPVAAYNVTLGRTLAYVGDERGDVIAFDETNGTTVWSTSVGYGDSERSTPLVAPDGSVWAATSYGSTLYKLNGATGAIECTAPEPVNMDASPNYVDPPGGVPSIVIATNDSNVASGPTVAVQESNCQQIWSFTQYLSTAGGWVEPAYGVAANGTPLILEGTADPDSTLYALNANTGALIWDYSVLNPPPGIYDIGSAATVSPPGNNGFADGVAYQTSKYGIMYALDLTTGALIWQTNFDKAVGAAGGGRSSAALVGNTLVFGSPNGAIALNATTGAVLWHFVDQSKTEVLSSPAVAGPAGNQIVTFGDSGGMFHVLNFQTGQELYNYQTGGYITSSPAIINHHILIDSTDGFLYDFALGGGNVAPPTTAVSSPTQGQSLPNPNGNLIVTGSATDATGLSSVKVSVQAGGPTGPWYDRALATWVNGPVDNVVAVGHPGAKQSGWKFNFPIPPAGATYQVFANAVDVDGEVDRTGVAPTFTVSPSLSEPTVTPSAVFVAPGSTFSVTANAFAPGETVVYTLQGTAVGSAVASSNGSVPPTNITVPATDAFGSSSLTATGQTSGDTSTATLNVTNIWTQAGYGALRTSYEPDDLVFAQTLQVNGGYVARAWTFQGGAAFDSSPAVVDGTAYVGNDAGQFFAVDTLSGAPLWTYTTSTGAPIHASPAVDINAGLLFFGSDDGTLYTLNPATGTLIGSAALDGIPTAPTIAAGNVYVGTDAGSVLALNETTGANVWTAKLGSAVHSAPAVDSAKSILVVGNDAGAVSALNATTGAPLWSVQTGATVSAPPAIGDRTVYVGSSNGNLYGISETNGKLKFTFAAGSPITAAVAVQAQGIVLGTQGGSLYILNALGKVTYQTTIKSAIVGIGATNDVPWFETSGGIIGATKNDQLGREVYHYQTGAGLSTAPAVLDGAVYIAAEDGGLYAFTPFGARPKASKIHRLVVAHALAKPPALWKHAVSLRAGALPARSFEPFGVREFAVHVDRPAAASKSNRIVSYGGPIQTAPRSYLIYWAPSGTGSRSAALAGAAALKNRAAYGGAVIDTAAYPRTLDDNAVQREIARQIALNGWKVDANAQVFVVAAGGRTASADGYCGYHSAFDLGGNLNAPVPYAFVPMLDASSRCGTLEGVLEREQTGLRTDPLVNGLHDERGAEIGEYVDGGP